MKHFLSLSICLLLSVVSYSQKYAIVDQEWKKPITYTDSVTKGSMQGAFVMYARDLDSLIIIVDSFRNIKDAGMHRTTFNASDYSTGNIETMIVNIKKPYGDSYDITLTVRTDQTKASFMLSESRINLPTNQKKIKAFYAYLKDGKKAWGGVLN